MSQVASAGYFVNGVSNDFNASIAANTSGDVFVTWSSNFATSTTQAQVRFSGKKYADPPATIGSGTLLKGSTVALTGNFDPMKGFQRWGDYSQVSIDPSDQTGATAWVVNEYILNKSNWATEFGKVHNP
jgi:hypothetical protein